MARAFPSLKPSSRKFTMGELPTKTYRSMAGTVLRRAYGNKKVNYTLDLEFKNIGDDDAVLQYSGWVSYILAHYADTNGTFETFTLPTGIFSGMGSDVRSYIQSPDSILWRYAEPPTVTSVRRGLSTVSVKLIGEIDH